MYRSASVKKNRREHIDILYLPPLDHNNTIFKGRKEEATRLT